MSSVLSEYAWVQKDGTLGIAKLASAIATDADDTELSIPFIVTTLTEDRDGDVVIPMGCQLHNFKHNPVCFFGHQQNPYPIAKCKSPDGRITVFPEENLIRAVMYFDREDEDAVKVYKKVKGGFLNATSIAFVPIDAERRDREAEKGLYEQRAHPHQQPMGPPGWIFRAYDLTEISVVGVPSNAGAIRDWLDTDKELGQQLRKSLAPYAAKSLGRSFSGWCPPGYVCEGGGCVKVEKVCDSQLPRSDPKDAPEEPPDWEVIVDGKAWRTLEGYDEESVIHYAKYLIEQPRRAQMPKGYTEEEFLAQFPRPKISVKGPYPKGGKPSARPVTKAAEPDEEDEDDDLHTPLALDQAPPRERWNKALSEVFDTMPECLKGLSDEEAQRFLDNRNRGTRLGEGQVKLDPQDANKRRYVRQAINAGLRSPARQNTYAAERLAGKSHEDALAMASKELGAIKALSTAFDALPELEMEPASKIGASTTHRVAAKYIGCEIKHLFQNATMVPAPRMGSFLTGLKHVLAEYKILEVRNISDRAEAPPVYETLQLDSKSRDNFLVQGTMFCEGVVPRGKRLHPPQVRKTCEEPQVRKGLGQIGKTLISATFNDKNEARKFKAEVGGKIVSRPVGFVVEVDTNKTHEELVRLGASATRIYEMGSGVQIKGSGPHNAQGRGDGQRFVVRFSSEWGGLNVKVFTHQRDAALNQQVIDRAWQWAKEHNFLKGEAFALSGEFLPRTAEDWCDVFLEEKNVKPLRRTIDLFNKKQKEFANRGVILCGPPGTGKTLSSRIIRNQAKGTFIWVSSRDFHASGSVGGIGLAFEMAKELAPTVLVMEDVDNWLSPTTIDLLKTEMDGVSRSKGVLTIFTTNFPEQLPDALIDRPGRFHDVLNFDLPTDECRRAMLTKWLPDIGKSKNEWIVTFIKPARGRMIPEQEGNTIVSAQSEEEARRKVQDMQEQASGQKVEITRIERKSQIESAVQKTQGYSGAHVYELAKFASDLNEHDDLPMTKALEEAIRKVEEQRELITKLQLSGSNYNPLRNRRKETSRRPAKYVPDMDEMSFSYRVNDMDEMSFSYRAKSLGCSCGSCGAGKPCLCKGGKMKQKKDAIDDELAQPRGSIKYPLGLSAADQQRMEQSLPTELTNWRTTMRWFHDLNHADGSPDITARQRNRPKLEAAYNSLINAWRRLPKSARGQVRKYITHSGDKWLVHSESGKVLGTHNTKESAERQLRAVEANKHKSRSPRNTLAKWSPFGGKKAKKGDRIVLTRPMLGSSGYNSGASGVVIDVWDGGLSAKMDDGGTVTLADGEYKVKQLLESSGTAGGYTVAPGTFGDGPAGFPTATTDSTQGDEVCQQCGGSGACPVCEGTGTTAGTSCQACDGSGNCSQCLGVGIMAKSTSVNAKKQVKRVRRRKSVDDIGGTADVVEQELDNEGNPQELKGEDDPNAEPFEPKASALEAAKAHKQLKALKDYFGPGGEGDLKKMDHPGMREGLKALLDEGGHVDNAMKACKDLAFEHHGEDAEAKDADEFMEKLCKSLDEMGGQGAEPYDPETVERDASFETGESNLVDSGEIPSTETMDLNDDDVEMALDNGGNPQELKEDVDMDMTLPADEKNNGDSDTEEILERYQHPKGWGTRVIGVARRGGDGRVYIVRKATNLVAQQPREQPYKPGDRVEIIKPSVYAGDTGKVVRQSGMGVYLIACDDGTQIEADVSVLVHKSLRKDLTNEGNSAELTTGPGSLGGTIVKAATDAADHLEMAADHPETPPMHKSAHAYHAAALRKSVDEMGGAGVAPYDKSVDDIGGTGDVVEMDLTNEGDPAEMKNFEDRLPDWLERGAQVKLPDGSIGTVQSIYSSGDSTGYSITVGSLTSEQPGREYPGSKIRPKSVKSVPPRVAAAHADLMATVRRLRLPLNGSN